MGKTKEAMDAMAEAMDVMAARRKVAERAAKAGLPVREYLRQRDERSRLRRRAESVGLAYWPALVYGPRIDSHAYLVAELVLAKKTGTVWGERLPDGSRSHGGWDFCGHYGLSPYDVAHMWWAAGCRDSGKFRFQLAAGIVARKGDTLPWLRNYARGLRWLNANRWIGGRVLFSRKAVAALGRLSPELRRAAVASLRDSRGVIRIRDLDWGAVRRAQDILRGGSVRARAALAGTRRACALLGVTEPELPAVLAPAYPRLPLPLARRVALGESPVQLSGGLLTRAEAHAWALDGAPADVAGWLARHIDVPAHRSVRVVRWLAHCRQTGRWGSLERERVTHAPGGGMHRFRALDILDEIQDEDIETGRDSVDAVLRRAAQRLGDAWLTEQMRDHRILAPMPYWAQVLPRWVRILRTPADLAREGKEMNHCVGGYANAVQRGQCHILAIASKHGRSTVELLPDLTVAQHRGPNNSSPPRRHEQLLWALIARIHRKEARYVA